MAFLEIITGAIGIIFFLTIISYYILLFMPVKKNGIEKKFSSITMIVPAHNEAPFIAECLDSILAATWKGKKQVIVVDDGSADGTAEIVKRYKGIVLLQNKKHTGKSFSINKALAKATGELVGIVDADSMISKESLMAMREEVGRKNVVAATCPIRVKNRTKHILHWVHLELLYNSVIRAIMAKINANIATPGPLSVYRRTALDSIGGFSTEGFSEDLDVTIRLIRKGHRIGFTEKAIAETYIPTDAKGLLRQRTRWARGMINVFKRHLKVNNTIIDIYTLPLFLFAYAQAVIMGAITFYTIISGYILYYASQGVYMSWGVAKFVLDWTSLIGFAQWAFGLFTGTTPWTLPIILSVLAGLLVYPLYILAALKYDRSLTLRHLLPLFFIAPFWWMIMIIYIVSLPEILMRRQPNVWKKNE